MSWGSLAVNLRFQEENQFINDLKLSRLIFALTFFFKWNGHWQQLNLWGLRKFVDNTGTLNCDQFHNWVSISHCCQHQSCENYTSVVDYSRTWNFQSFWCSFLTSLYTCQLWRIHGVCQKHYYFWILPSQSDKPIFVHEVVAISTNDDFWLVTINHEQVLLALAASSVSFLLEISSLLVFGFSIFVNSCRFCWKTPILYSELSVNFLRSDGEVKKVSRKMRQKLPFIFPVSWSRTDSPNPNSVLSFLSM